MAPVVGIKGSRNHISPEPISHACTHIQRLRFKNPRIGLVHCAALIVVVVVVVVVVVSPSSTLIYVFSRQRSTRTMCMQK